MLTFRLPYFLFAVLLFFIEVMIALYFHDSFVRPYLGDFLVVILIYCFVRAFFNFSITATAIGTLLFSFLVEFLQYLNIVEKLHLQSSRLARTVIGTSGEWGDVFAYISGIASVLLAEKIFSNKKKVTHRRGF